MTFRGEPSLAPVYSSALHPWRAQLGLIWASRAAEDRRANDTRQKQPEEGCASTQLHTEEKQTQSIFFLTADEPVPISTASIISPGLLWIQLLNKRIQMRVCAEV